MVCTLVTFSISCVPLGITRYALKRFNHKNVAVSVAGIHYKCRHENNSVRRAFVLQHSAGYGNCNDIHDTFKENLCRGRKLKLGEMTSNWKLRTRLPESREMLLQPSVSLQQLHCRHASTFFQAALESTPVIVAEELLTGFHMIAGLPWWATIMCATILLRAFVTTPLFVYQAVIRAKVENLKPEFAELGKQLAKEVDMARRQFGWDKAMQKRKFRVTMKRLISEAYIRENCHPFKASLVILVQLPLWFTVSFALRNMAGGFSGGLGGSVPEMATGGALWFSNLTVVDPTCILPVVLGIVNLSIIEMNALTLREESKLFRSLTYVFRGISIFMIPIAMTVPSAICLYWTTSSCFGLMQNILIKLPKVRRFCRIPITPVESQTPFRDMRVAIRRKFKQKRDTSS